MIKFVLLTRGSKNRKSLSQTGSTPAAAQLVIGRALDLLDGDNLVLSCLVLVLSLPKNIAGLGRPPRIADFVVRCSFGLRGSDHVLSILGLFGVFLSFRKHIGGLGRPPRISDLVIGRSFGLRGGDYVLSVLGFLGVSLSLCDRQAGKVMCSVLGVESAGDLSNVTLWVWCQPSCYGHDRSKDVEDAD